MITMNLFLFLWHATIDLILILMLWNNSNIIIWNINLYYKTGFVISENPLRLNMGVQWHIYILLKESSMQFYMHLHEACKKQ